jgi:hypothetical protein
MHGQPPFTSLSTMSNNLSENVSVKVGGRKHLSFWHGISNFKSLRVSEER